MAFDFLSFVVDQIQQNSQLFVEQPRDIRKYNISHITALQLMQLIQSTPQQSYQWITQQNSETLHKLTQTNIATDQFKQKLILNNAAFDKASLVIAQNILAELHQLNTTAQLQLNGIQELLNGQIPWIQDHVDEWFWDTTAQPEYKITKTHKNSDANFNQIIKEFNEIISKQDNPTITSKDSKKNNLEAILEQSKQLPPIIQAFIALLILCFLYIVSF